MAGFYRTAAGVASVKLAPVAPGGSAVGLVEVPRSHW